MAILDTGSVGFFKTTVIDADGKPADALKAEKPDAPDTGAMDSQGAQDYRKKRKDALEGKDAKVAKGDETEAKEGRLGREGDKRGEGTKGSSREGTTGAAEGEGGQKGGDSGGGKGGGGGGSTSQNLQSGQTTVQFSSGGMAGALGGLLALFSSPVNLVRAETGGIFAAAAQQAGVNLRTILQAPPPQASGFAGGEKNIGNVGSSSETVPIVELKYNLEGAGGGGSHGFTSAENLLAGLLSNINLTSAQGIGGETALSQLETLIIPPPTTSILTINLGNIIGSPAGTQFAFANPVSGTATLQSVLGSTATQISNDFHLFGLTPSSSYTYEVLSPVLTNTLPLLPEPNGITVKDLGAAEMTLTPLSLPIPASIVAGSGLTLTSAGDIYTATTSPLSVLIKATGANGQFLSGLRIDAGPGHEITQRNTLNFMLGEYNDPTGKNFPYDPSKPAYILEPTVFLDSKNDAASNALPGQTKIAGNAEAITINDTSPYPFPDNDTNSNATGYPSNSVVYFSLRVDATDSYTQSPDSLGSTTYTYNFPGSTIYRHVGNPLVPNDPLSAYAAFGNFSIAGGGGEFHSHIILPSSPLSYNVTFGGNVLDVYGPKYGIGDYLNVILTPSTQLPAPTNPPTPPPTLPTNTLTLGGNTLAGFGTAVGDLEILTITARSGDGMPNTIIGPAVITFKGNELAVDKGVSSSLWPHLQTLDLQYANTQGNTYNTNTPPTFATPAGTPSNVHIIFQPSILEGNTGGDTFYADIQNLAMTSAIAATFNQPGSQSKFPDDSATRYDGFVNPVTVSLDPVNGNVITTTADGANNSITWTSDLYGREASTLPSLPNTYEFPLLLNITNKAPVVPGEPIFTNFKIATDKLIFDLTPADFRAMEGASSTTFHDKTVHGADLNTFATTAPFDPAHPPSWITTLEKQYFIQNANNTSTLPNKTGITFNFNGDGSLTFLESSGDSNTLQIVPSLTGSPTGGFENIPNLSFNVASYDFTSPVAALATITTATTPQETPPYVYGGPKAVNPTPIFHGPYYNELDNFFSHSLFATYSVNGFTPTTVQSDLTVPNSPYGYNIAHGTQIFTIAPGVTIDNFGTISVTSAATTPILMPLTITATQHPTGDFTVNGNTATSTPELFGFLYAPVISINSGGNTTTLNPKTSSNIFVGELNSTLVGEESTTFTITATGSTPAVSQFGPYGSNLIVDTAGGATAYGDFITVNINAVETGGLTAATAPATPIGSITGQTIEFQPNAFDVTQGTVYGVDQTLNLTVQGGPNDTNTITQVLTSPQNLNDPGQFGGSMVSQGNMVKFDAQNIYGSGTIDGDGQSMTINLTAGSGKLQVDTADTSLFTSPSSHAGTLDVSAQVENNIFDFKPVTITIQGDTASTINIINPTIANDPNNPTATFLITTQPAFTKITTTNETLDSSATFSGNQFIFENDTINASAALGSTTINTGVNLVDPSSSPSPYDYFGFINGVTESTNLQGNVVITTTDGLNNAMTFGDKIITISSQAPTTISLDLVPDSSHNPYNLVLMGNISITNANEANSNNLLRFVFNEEVGPNPGFDPNAINIINTGDENFVTFSQGIDPHTSTMATLITFKGGGTLYLDGVTGISDFNMNTDWPFGGIIRTLPQSHAPAAPTLNQSVVFDPVFLTGVIQPDAFAAFINNNSSNGGVNPQTLSYTAGSSINPLTNMFNPLPSGVSLSSNDALSFSTSSPLDTSIVLTATNSVGSVTAGSVGLPATHIFAINAPFIDYDDTDPLIMGTPGMSSAFEVMAGTVYGGGASFIPTTLNYSSNLIYDKSASVSHKIDGAVPSILVTSAESGNHYHFNSNLMNINSDQIANPPSTQQPDSINGVAQSLTIDAPHPANGATQNLSFTVDGNTIYGTGDVYGDFPTLNLDGASGNGSIINNTFNFGANNLTDGAYLNGSGILNPGQSISDLHAGIGELDITGSATFNTLHFSDSNLTSSGGGIKEFYGDIANFHNSDFDSAVLPTTAVDASGHVVVYDPQSNAITFGNDIMNGSIASNTLNIFNIDLLSTPSFSPTGPSDTFVAEGNTKVYNFENPGPSNPNILNTQLSTAAYNDVVYWATHNSPNGGTLIPDPQIPGGYLLTPENLDYYLGGNTAFVNNGNTTIEWSPLNLNFSNPGYDLGSITLFGVTAIGSTTRDFQTNIEITANNTTTITYDAGAGNSNGSSTVYNVVVPGNTLSSYTADTHLITTNNSDNSLNLVDFTGNLDLTLSRGLFNALGLSNSNSSAQNLQILENNVNTSNGGIAVSTTTQTIGSNTYTNTVLTVESNNVHFGTITLHDTHFSISDPLTNHLHITHT